MGIIADEFGAQVTGDDNDIQTDGQVVALGTGVELNGTGNTVTTGEGDAPFLGLVGNGIAGGTGN